MKLRYWWCGDQRSEQTGLSRNTVIAEQKLVVDGMKVSTPRGRREALEVPTRRGYRDARHVAS
ncbi:hypothetical protein BamMEX5DRAFT_0355 [Burkholderia ambifaria MEX-5]|uniref:Uncharacterized protein n=1 Tax=Burkholderia ambifaria MEX-5 TaxID=396597 RepID=B1SXT9_9BURK|nr:hypothetical protein BamMEX5DRAFT_0355 [Burkholderia ambifaria MEX-5]